MVLIIGPGAVGTVLAAYLSRAGQRVKLLIREKYRTGFEAAPALRVDRSGAESLTAPKPSFATTLDLAGVDTVLICVKFADLDGVIDGLPQPLPPGLRLVSTLNGMQALRRLRERCGAHVANMTIMFNGQLHGPLHAALTTKPEVVISGDASLAALFNGSGMRTKIVEGDAAAWGKLLVNLANAVLALTHKTFKDLFTDPDLRCVYTAVLDEAAHVLDGAGHAFKLPSPLPYRASRWLLRHGGPLPWWQAKFKNGVGDGAFPSMVADVRAGRKTEVDQLNGEIVRLGEQHGIPTPLNREIVRRIHALEGVVSATYLQPAELRRHLLA